MQSSLQHLSQQHVFQKMSHCTHHLPTLAHWCQNRDSQLAKETSRTLSKCYVTRSKYNFHLVHSRTFESIQTTDAWPLYHVLPYATFKNSLEGIHGFKQRLSAFDGFKKSKYGKSTLDVVQRSSRLAKEDRGTETTIS